MTRSRTKTAGEEDPFAFLELDKVKPPKRGGPGRGWPDGVPVLTEGDLCWGMTREDGRMDLSWWMDAAFDHGLVKTPHQDKVYLELLKVLSERTGEAVTSLWTFLEDAQRRGKPSLGWQAACWNETMKRLGYEVPARKCKDPGR
jgi:hypothetical protein